MSAKTRRGLLIFICGFGAYSILLSTLGPLQALLLGLLVAAAAIYLDGWLRLRFSSKHADIKAPDIPADRQLPR
ncbi:hypothetical protein [Paenarthrobacter sp. FR1]|uniref:hypothetical protein n=1 Tax=Paenarthrobacter sp. FR1 TaxID=3439548 RepID=UPI003DA3CDC5